MDKVLIFPHDFLWGASTSAYQVEGGIENCDWSKIFPAGKACNHYNLYEQDFDLLKSLNLNAYRFSVEWSRVEPEEGKFNEKEIEHYQRIVLALRERGIEPFVGLWHYTNPVWIARKGGLESREFPSYFSRYAEMMASSLKENINFLITINEPEIYAYSSYLDGVWPPKKKNPISFLKVINNLIKTHQEAYGTIKKIKKNLNVGIATNNSFYEAIDRNPITFLVKGLVETLDQFYFLDRIANYQDFIGLNYYFHTKIRGFTFDQGGGDKNSDIDWEIFPKGIYRVLKNLEKYKKPIYVTENGLADKADKFRKDFIKDHLCWVHKAISEGMDVRGYFHWSLFDNFEWAKGYDPRFGLIEVNYETMERKIRPSASYYGEIAKNNGITI